MRILDNESKKNELAGLLIEASLDLTEINSTATKDKDFDAIGEALAYKEAIAKIIELLDREEWQ